MTYLIAGLVIFFTVHMYSAFRTREAGQGLAGKLGRGTYMGLISVASLVGLVLIIWGYVAARPSEILYVAPGWGRHLNYLLTPLALIVLTSAYLPTGYIKKAVKHPMLVSIKLWALGHLLANGELNSVLLFGSFLVFAVIDRIALKRRGDNGHAPDTATSPMGDVLAVLIGVGVSAAIALWLHPIAFGVAIWPPA